MLKIESFTKQNENDEYFFERNYYLVIPNILTYIFYHNT